MTTRTRTSAFTLIELLVATVIVGILAALSASVAAKVRGAGQKTACASSLRQLGIAAQLYLADHERNFFSYSTRTEEGDTLWYFGLESKASMSRPEGEREVDLTRGALYTYLNSVGKVEVCPAFPYELSDWKPKYRGASYGYGFNTLLSGRNAATLENLSSVIVFGDTAQVNTIQPPASSRNPLLEEFYIINDREVTVHFRHADMAQFVFVDGHVESLSMAPGTLDNRLPNAKIGRIAPLFSKKYLQ